MKRRAERLLLIFSIALNVAFLTTAAIRARQPEPAREPERIASPRFSSHWHGRRAAALGRRLHLERDQRRILRRELNELQPELENTRRDLFIARRHFRESLRRDDALAVRAARQRVSTIQTRLDSLTAEAMLTEIEVLHPEQRDGYLRWTFEPPRSRPARQRSGGRDAP